MRHNPIAVEGTDLLGPAVALELEQVERVHRMGDVAVTALRGVSLRIQPGEFVALVGPSGCGKSSLLSLIGGLDRATQGSVKASGLRLEKATDAVLSDYRLRRVGTVFQAFNLIPTFSAQDNVSVPMALAGVPRAVRRQRAQGLLDLVGLRDRAVVSQLARQQGIGLDLNVFQLSPLLALVTILLTALFSALSGLLPAARAARLAPVEALRYE